MTAESASRNHFFIGGEWIAPSSDRRFQLVDASTEERLGSVPEGVEADIDRAAAAARAAFDYPRAGRTGRRRTAPRRWHGSPVRSKSAAPNWLRQ
jgi:acyl-CoA reductase-like NAD-dependent aldehyde dehydrogenase